MRKAILGLAMMGTLLMLASCAWFANAPMDILHYRADEKSAQANLFIFMRGMGGSHRSFEEEGLVDDVRTHNLPFDMVAPNAHYGYYSGRTLIQRLKADVIDPARLQGKDHIWLVGISMGGLGSLLYLLEQANDIDGICLISPFLGYDAIIQEIQAAGGVRAWSPGGYDPNVDWQRMLWHWIKDNVAGDQPVPIYLAYGEEDRYSQAHTLLAAILPENRVVHLPGGHRCETFKALWDCFLESEIYMP